MNAVITQEKAVNIHIREEMSFLCQALLNDQHKWALALLNDPSTDVNHSSSNGETPLHIASRKGHTDIVRRLLQHTGKADVNQQDAFRKTPLHLAKHADVAELLLVQGKADVNKRDVSGRTPLHLAIANDHRDVVQVLLDNPHKSAHVEIKDGFGETCLIRACRYSHVDIVELLLVKGKADVNKASSGKGLTPLHHACGDCRVEIVKLLLFHGASVHQSDHTGESPLHKVAYCYGTNSAVEIAKCLLHHGADVHQIDDDGRSALHVAASAGHVLLARFLIEAQSDVNQVCHKGNTPLHHACQNGKFRMVEYLVTKCHFRSTPYQGLLEYTLWSGRQMMGNSNIDIWYYLQFGVLGFRVSVMVFMLHVSATQHSRPLEFYSLGQLPLDLLKRVVKLLPTEEEYHGEVSEEEEEEEEEEEDDDEDISLDE